VSNIICIILLVIVVATALEHLGMNTLVIRRVIFLVSLAVIGIIAVFRPLIPSLPFKVGNTVKVGDLLGKIEATTILNTRMRTFDGRTVFIPNSKIINDFVINYHFTKTRRIKVDVGIGYDQDILKAKQILETIMIEDPRVKVTPRPTVYVLNLTNNCVQLGGRCWVDNVKYWTTRCELIEKTKLRFNHEGITIAFPQLDVHHYHGGTSPEFPGEEDHIHEIEVK
jgi:small conductance mechanosensitive channel